VIIAVGSWRGTGATTTALLAATSLAASEGGAWLIEADPAGGVLAGRMQLPAHAVGGLERVAFPTARVAPVDAFEQVAHTVGDLRVVSAPADPFRAFACHQPRMPWVPALRDLAGPVVVDVGTLRAGSPLWGLLAQVDSVLLVASPEVGATVASTEWVQAGGRVSPADPGLVGATAGIVFVDAPAGVSFSRGTVQAELGDRFAGWLPGEPAAVDLVPRGATASDRRLRRSALMGAIGQVVSGLVVPEGAAR
jgi:hypothetical protein